MDPVPVIIFVVEQLLKIIEYRGKIAIKFEDELEEMKTHLAMMQSYLADTDNLKRKKQFLKATLIHLRDVAYEADDILTDCLLSESSSLFKRRWFRRGMGKKLRDLNSRMNKMECNLGKYLTDQHMIASQPGIVQQPRDELQGVFTSQVFNSSEIVGLEGDLSKIKGWISDSQIQLVQQRIGIVGMGGLGKTTIAQKVFNDGEVASWFNNRIWVSVSQCFREENVLACILQQLGGDGSIFDKGQMFNQICQLLTNKKYLIVLDDLWNTSLDWWNKLCSDLPKPTDHARGASCIIVTTRIEQVAIGMQVDRAKIHRPRTLNEQESWSLFCKHSFPKTGGRCEDVHFKELGESIAKKCKGLPLAIKTIGALLASKADMYSKWKEIEEDFHQLLTETESEDSNSIMASLELSYADLPSKLKQFLLCFSIYPEDAVMDGEQLIRWWVGEGLIQAKDSKTATEAGYECLSQLASRCLIEVQRRRGYDGRIYSCKMHDMVRELTIRIAQDQEFCKFDEKGRQKVILTDSRWLGLTDQVDTNSLKDVPNPKLRAMLLLPMPPSTSHKFDKIIMELKLKSLRVLDLSHSKIELTQDKDHKAFWDWITSFGRLAYLNLSGLSDIKELPRCVEKLHNLQLLILRECNNLRVVDKSIINLKKLIILDLGQSGVQYLPRGLGRLSNLQELSGFRISASSAIPNKACCSFSELKELNQLRVLRINLCDESTISKDELKVLSQLGKLKVLAINADECSSSSKKKMSKFRDDHILNMLDKLSPPSSIEELYLKNYRRDTLWQWINPDVLFKLQYLCIEDGNLEQLQTSEACSSTWKIEGLYLKFLQRLDVEWKMLNEEMPLLRYVEASHCSSCRGFPFDPKRQGVWNK